MARRAREKLVETKNPALHRDVLFIGMPIPELVVAAAQTKLREKKKQGL
jgi:hypothetical protein